MSFKKHLILQNGQVEKAMVSGFFPHNNGGVTHSAHCHTGAGGNLKQ